MPAKAPVSNKREVSVMAWIEDPYGHVLMIRQRVGKKAWTFPGGKVRFGEGLLQALKRELKEETGYSILLATPLDIYDRADRNGLAVLFRVLIKKGRRTKPRADEVSAVAFKEKLPANATPSARFFFSRAERSFEPLFLIQE